MAQRNLMTIEEIKDHLMQLNPESWSVHDVARIIDSITAIRTEGYNEGWDDSLAEFDV